MEETAEHEVEGDRGVGEDVLDLAFGAIAPEALGELLHQFEVFGSNVTGVGVDRFVGFHVHEVGEAIEVEIDLLVIEDVEEHDAVTFVTEVSQGTNDFLLVVVEVADDDDEAPTRDGGSHVVEDLGKAGVLLGLKLFEDAEDLAKMDRGAVWENSIGDPIVEGDHADGVLLPDEQVGQGGGEVASVFELVEGAAAIGHAGGDIEEDIAPEVGLLLVLLDVKAVRSGEALPVEVSQIVARAVLAVFGELDGEAVEGAAVETGDEPLDSAASDERQVAELRNGFWSQILVGTDLGQAFVPVWRIIQAQTIIRMRVDGVKVFPGNGQGAVLMPSPVCSPARGAEEGPGSDLPERGEHAILDEGTAKTGSATTKTREAAMVRLSGIRVLSFIIVSAVLPRIGLALPVTIPNPGAERVHTERSDRPADVNVWTSDKVDASFTRDTSLKRSGKASFHIVNRGRPDAPKGAAQSALFIIVADVVPGLTYSVTGFIKTENVEIVVSFS